VRFTSPGPPTPHRCRGSTPVAALFSELTLVNFMAKMYVINWHKSLKVNRLNSAYRDIVDALYKCMILTYLWVRILSTILTSCISLGDIAAFESLDEQCGEQGHREFPSGNSRESAISRIPAGIFKNSRGNSRELLNSRREFAGISEIY